MRHQLRMFTDGSIAVVSDLPGAIEIEIWDATVDQVADVPEDELAALVQLADAKQYQREAQRLLKKYGGKLPDRPNRKKNSGI